MRKEEQDKGHCNRSPKHLPGIDVGIVSDCSLIGPRLQSEKKWEPLK